MTTADVSIATNRSRPVTVFMRRVARKLLGVAARASQRLSDRVNEAADRVNSSFPLPVTHSENVRFKDMYVGRRAFVIGNGPSLATQDISLLTDELVFTMNSFDRHPLCAEFRHLHHFLADPQVVTDDAGWMEMMERIAGGIGDSPVFIPAWGETDSKVLKTWKDRGQLWPIPMRGSLAEEPVSELDMTTGFPNVQSTSQLAIMTAVYMGCSPIYLLGLDSDWAASNDLDRHFYAQPTVDKDKVQQNPVWSSYQGILECTLLLWKGYGNLRDYCDGRGVQIYNATAGGLLDVFPRARYEDVV